MTDKHDVSKWLVLYLGLSEIRKVGYVWKFARKAVGEVDWNSLLEICTPLYQRGLTLHVQASELSCSFSGKTIAIASQFITSYHTSTGFLQLARPDVSRSCSLYYT